MDTDMPFDALERSLELVEQLATHVSALEQRNADLASQLRRAARTLLQNLAEGRVRDGEHRRHHFRVAAGSAEMVRACLEVAAAWGDLDIDRAAAPLATLDRVAAMLYRLTHGPARG